MNLFLGYLVLLLWPTSNVHFFAVGFPFLSHIRKTPHRSPYIPFCYSVDNINNGSHDGVPGQPQAESTIILSPLAALDHFLSVCDEYNQKKANSVEIISRGSTKLPNHQEVEVGVYAYAPGQDDHLDTQGGGVVITVVSKGRQVDLSKLEMSTGISSIYKVPVEDVASFCGFPPGSIPPFGHCTKRKVTVVVDQDLFLYCQSNDLRILGSAGYAYWQCLVDPEVMISLANVQVVPISFNQDDAEIIEEAVGQDATSRSFQMDLEAAPASFLQVEPPPMTISRLVVDQRDLSNPLVPALVRLKGRIGKIDRRGKRTANCEFLPLLVDDEPELAYVSGIKDESLPWKSSSGESMAVELAMGKPLIQKLGTTQGEIAIGQLAENLVIEVEARTNVGNRDALSKWVEARTMELIVMDYRVYTSEGTIDESFVSSDTVPYKHKPVSSVAVPILPPIRLEDIFEKVSATIKFVDNMQSLESFAHDVELLECCSSEAGASMVGIDCEWQPNQLSAPGDPHPVLLMQLSLQTLGKIYLFDLQTIFRPMLHQREPMNEIEAQACRILSRLWLSDSIVKVGYQLSSDLRLIYASYPHLECFQEVHSVLEVDNLVKQILRITKQKKSRSITTSLATMTSHYMGKTVDKSCQISDWKARPLTDSQRLYAALDAAVAPALAERALASVNATIDAENPRIQRWPGDDALVKVLDSMHFSLVDAEDPKRLKKLQAKQIVGDNWIATQKWIAGQEPPAPIS